MTCTQCQTKCSVCVMLVWTLEFVVVACMHWISFVVMNAENDAVVARKEERTLSRKKECRRSIIVRRIVRHCWCMMEGRVQNGVAMEVGVWCWQEKKKNGSGKMSFLAGKGWWHVAG